MRHTVLSLSLVIGVSAVATAQPQFQGLGQLAPAPGAMATAISSDGITIVGRGVRAGRVEAFRWTLGTGIEGLGDLAGATQFGSEANGVSADGSVIAGNVGGLQIPARWTAAGWQALSGVAQGGIAWGVSGNGQYIVGQDSVGSGFRWSVTGGSETIVGNAYGVSYDGSVVVGRRASPGGFNAYRWTAATGSVSLGVIPGATEQFSEALAVSGDGQAVVGFSAAPSQTFRAFRWTALTGMVDLGDLPGGFDESRAQAVSFDGSVVVGYGTTTVQTAFLWTAETGMVSLQSYLLGLGATGLNGWALTQATGVSADGRVITGWGRNPAGVTESFVAVIPAPGSLGVLAVAGLVAVRRRRLVG